MYLTDDPERDFKKYDLAYERCNFKPLKCADCGQDLTGVYYDFGEWQLCHNCIENYEKAVG